MNEFQPQNRVTTHFDNAANVYFDWYKLQNLEGHSFRIRKTRCMEMLAKNIPAGGRVSDAGCGPATMVKELLDAGYEVMGTDIAPHMIEECQKRFANNPRASFAIAPANALPVADGSQDAVTAMGLLEYLNDEPATLKEFHRALKSGGVALLTYPHYWSPARIWNRFTHLLAKPILAITRRGKPAPGVKHREYHLVPTIEMVKAAGFEVSDVVFYNFKLGFRPLDTLLPVFFMKIAEALEPFCRTPILRRLGTGFIILAKKPGSVPAQIEASPTKAPAIEPSNGAL
jgi:ubiquinone/menaquinone biosynthesis C-methylase UbiE